MYSEKSDKELLELLEDHALLTFESQLCLKEELAKRNLNENISDLDQAISDKLAGIKNLEYLKDYGLSANRDENGLVITRTTKAMLTDILAVILGLIVFFIGIYGIVNLVMTFVNGEELDVFTLAFKFAVAALVFIGLSFLGGLKRLFDYSGFELSNRGDGITLRKRFDVKLEDLKASQDDLYLDYEDDSLQLKLSDEVILTSTTENLVQKMTLEELTKQLKNG
ncbi:hypothetical protein ACOCEA_17145 [Maribacter sp. CXY002]|uniref:hypothetical protein n=1 Tax=Maribacter luteocoastalis TaxID=3407671 RepID=UPI003B66E3C7